MSKTLRRNRPALPVLVLAVVACSTEPSDPGFSARDSIGVQILTTVAGADSTAVPWMLAPTPSLDIGTPDGDESSQFFAVGDILRLSDGTTVVENRGSSEIRFFDTAGNAVSRAGGSGEGPGEYRSLAGIAEGPGALLTVFDRALGRLTVLDAEANLIGTVQLQPTGSAVHPLRLYRIGGFLEDSVVALLAIAYPADMQPTPMVYWDSVPTLAYHLDGTLRDTVAEFSGMDMYATGARTGGHWFGRYTSAGVHGGEIFITDGGAYEVRVYGPDGELRRILRYARDSRAVTPKDAELLSDAFISRATNEEDRRAVRRMLSERPLAERKPWISGLIVDETGAVWVEEWEPYWVGPSGSWGVFAAEGQWLGRVLLPARFSPREIGPDYVLGVWRDDLDVEHVQVYGLQR